MKKVRGNLELEKLLVRKKRVSGLLLEFFFFLNRASGNFLSFSFY